MDASPGRAVLGCVCVCVTAPFPRGEKIPSSKEDFSVCPPGVFRTARRGQENRHSPDFSQRRAGRHLAVTTVQRTLSDWQDHWPGEGGHFHLFFHLLVHWVSGAWSCSGIKSFV